MSLVERRATETPHGIAAISGDSALTFRELLERCQTLLGTLRLEPFDPRPLAFVAHNDLSTFILVHALLHAGRTALPLNPRLIEPEQDALVQLANASLLRREQDGYTVAQTAPTVRRARPSTTPSRPQQLLIATSGSSGVPKLVSLSTEALASAAVAQARLLALTAADRWLLSLNVAHIGGYSILTRCLYGGSSVVISPTGRTTEELVHTLERQGITLLSLVPTQLKRLLELQPSPNLPSLRALLVGGASCPSALLRKARERGLPALLTYGMSETAALVTAQPLSDLSTAGTLTGDPVDCGIALDAVELRIVNGELEVRGPSLFDGYLVPHDATLDRNDVTPDGWFRTGDLGYLSAQGRFVALGRRSDRIVTGGENVSPLEIETALLGLPEVAQAVVVGVVDPEWGEAVAAAVVPQDRTPRDPEPWLAELGKTLRLKLGAHKCPKRWLCLEALPMLPSGKLDRSAVARLFAPQ